MPKQQRILIMISPKLTPVLAPSRRSPVDSDSDASSTMSMLDLNEPSETLETLLTTLKGQLTGLAAETRSARHQVKQLFARAKTETTDWWSEPLSPSSSDLSAWLKKHGASAEPSLSEFVDLVLSKAKSLDLESRVLTFSKGDAAVLFDGQTQATVFELLTRLPTLFR